MTSNSSQDNRVSNPSQEPYDLKVVKEYPPRGSWTLHRLASPTSFTYSRCDRVKKAKLVATRDKNWDALYYNACYSLLLSKH